MAINIPYTFATGAPIKAADMNANFATCGAYTDEKTPWVTPEMFGTVDGVADDVQIQAAIDSLTSGGTVIFAAKTYTLSAPIVLKYGVSLCGAGGRATKIVAAGDYAAISWDQSIVSYDHNITISDLWLYGNGVASGSTNNHGILINHPWGIDSLTIKNVFITQFGAYGIKTYQPGSGGTHNCFQFSHWDSVTINTCYAGILMGNGFCGESLFSNIIVQYCTSYALEFTISSAGIGPQGLTFDTCTFGAGVDGIKFGAASRGVLTFSNCHLEGFTGNTVSILSNDYDKIVFDKCWFILNRGTTSVGIYATNGKVVDCYSCSWYGSNAGQKFIYLPPLSSNVGISLNGNHNVVGTATLTTEIQTVSITSISGNIQRTSTSTGKINNNINQINFLQTRGLQSELATVFASNLGGSVTIGGTSTSVDVSFTRTEGDANYQIVCTVDAGTATPGWYPGISVGSKLTTGFTAYFSSTAPAGYKLNWILVRTA